MNRVWKEKLINRLDRKTGVQTHLSMLLEKISFLTLACGGYLVGADIEDGGQVRAPDKKNEYQPLKVLLVTTQTELSNVPEIKLFVLVGPLCFSFDLPKLTHDSLAPRDSN
jgi:hypothetical protein